MSRVSTYFKNLLRASPKSSAQNKLVEHLDLSREESVFEVVDETNVYFDIENTDFDYSLSDDNCSNLMHALWKEFLAQNLSRAEATTDNVNSRKNIFSSLRSNFIEAISKTKILNVNINFSSSEKSPANKDGDMMSRLSISNRDSQSIPDGAHEVHITAGHPRVFLEELMSSVLNHLNFRASVSGEAGSHLFLCDGNTDACRDDFILSLRSLSLAIHFSVNCSNIRSHLRREHYSPSMFCCLLLNTFTVKLEQFSAAAINDGITQNTVYFIFQSILYALHLFINSSVHQTHTDIDFDTLSPPQPWTTNEDLEFLGFNVKAPGEVDVRDTKDSLNNSKRFGYNTGRMELKAEFTTETLTSEALLTVVELLKSLSAIKNNVLACSYQDNRMNEASSWLIKCCLILRAESLLLLNHWLLFDPSKCTVLTSSIASPIFTKVITDHRTADLIGWDTAIDYLTVRCSILVLKLNCTLNVIPVESICDFLCWAKKNFDYDFSNVPLPTSRRVNQIESNNAEYVFSLSFVEEFSKPPMIYDLWPWGASRLNGTTVNESMLIDESSDFRLLKPEALYNFKSSMALHPVYVMWDAIFSEILGSRSLSLVSREKKTSINTNTRKIKRENVFLLCELCQRVFEQEVECTIPFCQLFFVDFLSQLIKALENTDIFFIVHHYRIFDILFGKQFLLGSRTITTNQIEIKKNEVSSRKLKTIEFAMASDHISAIFFWLVLNEMTFDYLNGLVLYSTFFCNESHDIPSFFTHDDVLLLLIDFASNPQLSQHHQMIFQLIKLVHNILSMVSSMGNENVKATRDKVFGRLLPLSYQQRSQSNFRQLKPAQLSTQGYASVNIADDSDMENSSPFCWASHSIVISMMLQLSTENYLAPVLPVFTETVPSNIQKKSVDHDRSFVKMRSSTLDSEPSTFRHSSVAKLFVIDNFDILPSNSLESYCKEKIKPFLLLLLDPKSRGAGLYLLSEVIAACGFETLHLQSNPNFLPSTEIRELKSKYRTLASEVIDGLLDIVGYTAKFPATYDGLNLAIDCLRLLTWLLRSKIFASVRIFIQEYFRRSGSISHLLFALTKCVLPLQVPTSSVTRNIPQRKSDPNAAALIGNIVKQGITLLTSVMASHDACKDEFGLIVQSSRDGGDLLTSSNDIYETSGHSLTSRISTTLRSSSASSKSIDTIFNLILKAEAKNPSKEVVLIIFEMLLDGQYVLNEEMSTIGLRSLFGTDEDRPKIRNIHIIHDLFCLIPFCESEMQLFIFESFQNLITGRASLVNLNACSLTKPRVLDLALDLFRFLPDELQQYNVQLIQSLGKHGVPVSSLKHLFRILHSKNDVRPSYSWRVIQALHGMVTEEDGPRQTFVFEGTCSGLKLPPIYYWPASKAFSFCIWFKIEAKKVNFRYLRTGDADKNLKSRSLHGSMPKSYSPYILCLRSEAGTGLELFLQPITSSNSFQIVLRSHLPGKPVSSFAPKSKSMRVLEGTWHFLAFSISSSTYYKNGEARIQLDDVYQRSEFHMHKFTEPILHPTIGDCLENLRDDSVNTTMRGQMGAVYFFSTSLSEGQLQSIHALGPDYIYNFEPYSAVYRDVTNASKKKWVDPILSILDGMISSKIFMAFNPAVWRGDVFLDNTPLKNDVKWKIPADMNSQSALEGVFDSGTITFDGSGFYKMHAFCLPGTYRSTTQDVRLALNSLGGIKILFPLFAQLDQSKSQPILLKIKNNIESEPRNIDSSHDPHFLVSILDLLTILLDNNMENQNIFLKLSGFSIISCLLERVSPEHFSVNVINKVIDLCSKLESNAALHEAVIDQLICNFKLWVFTPLTIQEIVLSYIKTLIAKSSNMSIESFSFQRWVDVLSLLYDFDLIPVEAFVLKDSIRTESSIRQGELNLSHKFAAPLPVFSPSPSPIKSSFAISDDTKSSTVMQSLRAGLLGFKSFNTFNVSYKLSHEELVVVRSYIFSFLHITIRNQNEVHSGNINALVSYLLHSPSRTSQIEVLQFILELLDDKQNPFFPPQVACGFAQNNSLSALFPLYGSPCPKVRLLTVILFTTVTGLALNDRIIPSHVKLSRPQQFMNVKETGIVSTPITDDLVGQSTPLGSISSFHSTTGSVNYVFNQADFGLNSRSRTVSETIGDGGSFSVSNSPTTTLGLAMSSPLFVDAFDALDLSPDIILGVIITILNTLLEGLSKASAASCGIQALIIFNSFSLAMFGESPLFLFEEVGHVFSAEDQTSPVRMWGVENFNRITKCLNDFVHSAWFKEKILFIPMIHLALIDFLSSECVSAEIRLQGVLTLHTVIFSNDKNCEAILSVSGWYVHFFRLLDMETKRRNRLFDGTTNNSVALAACNLIMEITAAMLCELQKRAVFIGKPRPIAKLTRIGDFKSNITRNEVTNKISRGERQLGMFVLRDNISFLREHLISIERSKGFVESGSIDQSFSDGLDVIQLGLQLLKVALSELQREQEQLFKVRVSLSVTTSGSEIIMQDHQEKIFHINSWLHFTAVFDFLNHMWVKRDYFFPREIVDNDWIGVLNSSYNNNSPFLYSSDVDNAYEESKWAFFSSRRTELIEIHNSCAEDDRNDQGIDSYRGEKKLWLLMVKLCVLVQPLYTDLQLAGWMYEEKYFRVQTGTIHAAEPHLYNKSNSIQSSVQDSVLNLAMNLPSSGYVRQLQQQSKKVPLSHTSGGVLWLLVKVLCSAFAQGLDWANEKREFRGDADSHFHVWQCLNQLKKLLVSLEIRNSELFEHEAFYVIGKLSEFVRKSPTISSHTWEKTKSSNGGNNEVNGGDIFQNTLDIILYLVEKRSSKIIEMLNSLTNNKHPELYLDCEEPGDSTIVEDVKMLDTTLPTYETLTKAVMSKLQIASSPFLFKLNSSVWNEFTVQQIALAERKESREINNKFKEIEILSFPSSMSPQAMNTTVENANSSHGFYQGPNHQSISQMQMDIISPSALASDWEKRAKNIRISITDCFVNRLRDWVKTLELNFRRCDAKWLKIFAESANERGPWGIGGGEKSDVYWMLDNVENNMHMKLRLRRNLMGNKHALASQKSAGKLFRPSTTTSQKSTKSSLEEEDTTSSNAIPKGLRKYKFESKASSGMIESEADLGDVLREVEDDEDVDDALPHGGNLLVDSDTLQLFSAPCEIITAASNSAGGRTLGRLEVSKAKISFQRTQDGGEAQEILEKIGNNEFLWACQPIPSTFWAVEEILAVSPRLYQLRSVAVEIFFTSRTSIFINLFDIKPAAKLYRAIKNKMKAPNLNSYFSGKAKDMLSRPLFHNLNVTQAWMHRKITNFDYLMYINLIAGRTFNDLSQYPIFPWVLRDYRSQKLDLRDPSTFREFHWPVGAQKREQRALLVEKYKSFAGLQDDEILPYHFGSHYSTSAMVIWYLIRMEPFTSYHVWLQDGKFDFPDRLFHSIEATWKGCTTNFQDVKELIPEFFSMPEILENINDLDMGYRQDGQPLKNVILPNWAKDAHDFVRQHREALESEYVSRHLHSWIDLIFGNKQRPPHIIGGSESAVNACNVFVHLTYKDAVNLEEVKRNDPVLYNQTIRQIDNYGQTPTQIFDKPHPERLMLDQMDIIWPIASVFVGVDTLSSKSGSKMVLDKPNKVLCYGEFKISNSPILLVAESRLHEKLVTVDSSRIIGVHSFTPSPPDRVPPFIIKIDKYSLSSNAYSNTTSGSQDRVPSNKGSALSVGSPAKNGRIARYLSSHSVKEKLAGVPFASEGMLLHGSHSGSKSGTVSSEGRLGEGAGTTLYVPDSRPNLIGTSQNKVAYLAEEGGSSNHGSSPGVGNRSKKSVELNRAPSKSISISYQVQETSATSTVASATTSGVLHSTGLPPRPDPVRRSVTATDVTSAAQSTPSKASVSGSASNEPSHDELDSSFHNSIKRGEVMDRNQSSADLNAQSSSSNSSSPPMKAGGGGAGVRKSRRLTNLEDSSPSQIRAKGRVDEHLSGNLFAMLADFKLLFSCGHWDNSIKVTGADTGKLIQSISHHRELVTCVCVASDLGKHWLVSGSRDCTVIVWELLPERDGEPVNPNPEKILYGHDDCVNCVSLHCEQDLIVSGSDDGTVILHSLRDGQYLRSILIGSTLSAIPSSSTQTLVSSSSSSNNSSSSINSHLSSRSSSGVALSSVSSVRTVHQLKGKSLKRRVHLLSISGEGYLVAYSADGHLLCTYSINGRFIKMTDVRERVYAMCVSEDGKVVLTGGERGLVVLRWVLSLSIADGGGRRDLESVIDGGDDKEIGPFSSPIRSLYITNQERHLIVGLESGHIRILAQDSEYLRRKLHKKLVEIGILTL